MKRRLPIFLSVGRREVSAADHGAGWSRFTGTFVVEPLASHGYMGFSIDHPGRNRTTLFADGVSFRADTMPGEPRQDLSDDPRAGGDGYDLRMAVTFRRK